MQSQAHTSEGRLLHVERAVTNSRFAVLFEGLTKGPRVHVLANYRNIQIAGKYTKNRSHFYNLLNLNLKAAFLIQVSQIPLLPRALLCQQLQATLAFLSLLFELFRDNRVG